MHVNLPFSCVSYEMHFRKRKIHQVVSSRSTSLTKYDFLVQISTISRHQNLYFASLACIPINISCHASFLHRIWPDVKRGGAARLGRSHRMVPRMWSRLDKYCTTQPYPTPPTPPHPSEKAALPSACPKKALQLSNNLFPCNYMYHLA